MGERRTVVALGLIVGLVLADSSVVILALPDILDHFNVSIDHVAWVLTLFNLVLAVVAVPAAYLSRRFAPSLVCSAGAAAVRSGLAGLRAGAPTSTWLLVSRAVQAVGGAAAVCAALELLSTVAGSEKRAVRRLGGGRRARCGGRTGRRRRADRRDQLAGDLLRAGAAGAGGAGADPAPLHEGRPGRGPGRPARAGAPTWPWRCCRRR